MKNFISAGLIAAMLISSLSACSGNVTDDLSVSSASDVSYYSAMLTERLGFAPEGVVLGIGSSKEYGVDMTDFESDGYVIRTVDDTTVIFGKTEDGLDRAVRKYAKAVETDSADALNEVYHEGYRIERLTIAGIDISEYTVSYPEDANENVKFAASELARLVKIATGTELPIVAGECEGPAFTFILTDDPEMKTEGYRYTVTESGVVIEHHAVRGAMNAVWRFLQNECGWESLIFGDSFLHEADHIDIPAGVEKAEAPAFEYMNMYNPYSTFKNERKKPVGEQYGPSPITGAMHGLQTHDFCHDPNSEIPTDFTKHPCFTSEDVFEITKANVDKYIAATGTKEVDIAMYDTDQFCLCDTCIEVFREEGGHSGVVVRFANRLSEELNEKYPDRIYKIFAYGNTTPPPNKTVPNEFLYVTFCYAMNCSNHKVDGTECTGKVLSSEANNTMFAEWMDGWSRLTSNIYIWPYTMGTGLSSYTVLDNIYDDYRYYYERGIYGIFLESEDCGKFSTRTIEHQLAWELNWNIDMTEEEFTSIYHSLLEKEYGDGWQYILEYIDQWNVAQDLAGCWQCWGWHVEGGWDDRYDCGYFRERFDLFIELFEAALAAANSKAQEIAVNSLYASMLYKACYASYYFEWLDSNDERIAVLSERYDKCLGILRSLGYNPAAFPTTGPNGLSSYSPTLYEAAWNEWLNFDGFTRVTGQELPENAPTVKQVNS